MENLFRYLVGLNKNIPAEEITCFSCKYFDFWDGDPVCFYEDGWCVVLPGTRQDCKHHINRNGILKDNYKCWERYKRVFFERYTIGDEYLKKYLRIFPKDRDFNINVI